MEMIEAVSLDNVSRRNTGPMKSRHLVKFQRQGMFLVGTSEAQYQRASTVDDLEAAFRLVHDVFVEKNFILPRPSGMRIRVFETSPELAMFVGKIDGEVVGTIGLVVDSPDMGLPSDRVFGDELDELRSRGKTVCEVTNLAVRFGHRKGPMCSELMRCVMAQAWESNCHYLTCAVSPQQKKFYEFIGFYQIGSERSYSEEVDDPVVSMCWDLGRLRQLWKTGDSVEDPIATFWKNYCLDDNPYLERISEWNTLAEETYSDVFELSRLFGKCGDFFDECTDEQLKIVRLRLGEGIDLGRVAVGQNTHLPEPRFLPDSVLRLARHSHLRKRSRSSGTRSRGGFAPEEEVLLSGMCRALSSSPQSNEELNIGSKRVLRE